MKKLVLIPTTLIVGLAPAISFVGCGGDTPEPEPTPPTGDYLSIKSNRESTIGVCVSNYGEYYERTPDLSYWDGTKWIECEFVSEGRDEYTWEIQTKANNNYTIYLKGDNDEGLSIDEEDDGASFVSIECFDTPSNNLEHAEWTLGGSVMGLINDGNMDDRTKIPNPSCFKLLFGNNKNIVHVNKDFLPATELDEECYMEMFASCSNLQDAPDLPATIVPNHGYCRMFLNCDSIQNAPTKLEATEIGSFAYQYMFYDCDKLAKPAKMNIDATYLDGNACNCMYQSCDSLEMPDDFELPASATLVANCYVDMFADCKSLTKTCKLPTENLCVACYERMFSDCPKLQTIEPIIVKDDDTTGKWDAFKGIFEITDEVSETPEYRFNETTGDDAVVDLSEYTTDITKNFKDMFKGRLGTIQQPEAGKKYAFENHAQRYDINIEPRSNITVDPTKFELGQDLVITYSPAPYYVIDEDNSFIQVGVDGAENKYYVKNLEQTGLSVKLPGEFVTDKNITVDFSAKYASNIAVMDQYSEDFWGKRSNLHSEEKEIEPDTTYYFYIDLTKWGSEIVGQFHSIMIGTKMSDEGQVKLLDNFTINSDLGQIWWAVLSEESEEGMYYHTNINIYFDEIIQYLFGIPSYLYGTITTDHWEGNNPTLSFFFY